MSLSTLTRQHICNSFKALASTRPFFKITVKDIVENTDINKSTFYYHFEDKFDLIRTIYRADIAEVLCNQFDEKILVYPDDTSDRYADLPYYINARNPQLNLDYTDFFTCLIDYLLNNADYYSNMFLSSKPEGLKFYFHNLYLNEMRKDLLYALGDRHLPEPDISFLAQYFTSASFDYFFVSIPQLQKGMVAAELGFTHNNITHELMKYYLDRIVPPA